MDVLEAKVRRGIFERPDYNTVLAKMKIISLEHSGNLWLERAVIRRNQGILKEGKGVKLKKINTLT